MEIKKMCLLSKLTNDLLKRGPDIKIELMYN